MAEKGAPVRVQRLRSDKWTSPQVKSFNLLRSKSEANLNRLIAGHALIGLLKEAADISKSRSGKFLSLIIRM